MTHSNSVRVRGAKECIIYDYQIHFSLVKVLPRKNIDRFWIGLNNFLGIFSFYLIIICLINTLWDGIGNISSQNYDKVLIFYWTSKFMKISCAKVQFIVYTKTANIAYGIFLPPLPKWFPTFYVCWWIYQQEIVQIEHNKSTASSRKWFNLFRKIIDKISEVWVSLLCVDLSANWFYPNFLSN